MGTNQQGHEFIREEKRKELKKQKTNARQKAYYKRQKELKKNEEEKRKELKRQKTNARQRAYYYRQKDLKKNEEKIKRLKRVPKSNAERQRKFRENRKRQKLCSNEENIVRCSALENIDNVTLQENQFLSQQLHIYEQRNECITPEVILHRNTGIPGDGNCLFHSLISVLQLQIESCDLRNQLRDSPYLNSCHNPQEAYKILSSSNDYGDLDCLYLFSKMYNQNVCVHYCFYNITTTNEETIFCHFKANGTQNWIHLHLREQHFTPFYEVSDLLETVQDATQNEAHVDANIEQLRDNYDEDPTEDNHNNNEIKIEIDIEDRIGENNMDFIDDGTACRNKWINMRNVFTRHTKPDNPVKSKYYAYDEMKFYKPFLEENTRKKNSRIQANLAMRDEVEENDNSDSEIDEEEHSRLQPHTSNISEDSSETPTPPKKQKKMMLVRLAQVDVNKKTKKDDAKTTADSKSTAESQVTLETVLAYLQSLSSELLEMNNTQFRTFKRRVLTLIDDIVKPSPKVLPAAEQAPPVTSLTETNPVLQTPNKDAFFIIKYPSIAPPPNQVPLVRNPQSVPPLAAFSKKDNVQQNPEPSSSRDKVDDDFQIEDPLDIDIKEEIKEEIVIYE